VRLSHLAKLFRVDTLAAKTLTKPKLLVLKKGRRFVGSCERRFSRGAQHQSPHSARRRSGLHPSLHKPTEQISRIGVAHTGNKVSNSGIIILEGHRVFISFVTTWS
jgi:hypothetical protein